MTLEYSSGLTHHVKAVNAIKESKREESKNAIDLIIDDAIIEISILPRIEQLPFTDSELLTLVKAARLICAER